MKKGSFCLVGPNVEQAVYSCNDEDIVVNLIMRFSSFAESFLGLMREQGIMSGISLANGCTADGQMAV